MNYNRLCINCMKEKPTDTGRCPYCGFDLSQLSQDEAALRPFTVLNAKYLTGRVLGSGGFGITYIALDMNLERAVCIKEFFMRGTMYRNGRKSEKVSVSDYDESQTRMLEANGHKFVHEAKTLARLERMPGIVKVYDYFEENNTAYIVMEYLDGMTLKDYVKSHGGRLHWKEVLDRVHPILESLKSLHAIGIWHRDISPDNIMVMTDGSMTLFDFGGAKETGDQRQRSQVILRKKGYSPIEQYGTDNHGTWTDVYAMSATIYFCLTGEAPVESINRSISNDPLKRFEEFGIELPEHIAATIYYGLAVRYTDRCQTIDELEKRLYQSSGVKPVPPEPRKPPKPKPLKPKRPKWLLPVLITSGVLAAVTIVLILITADPMKLRKKGGADNVTTEKEPVYTTSSQNADANNNDAAGHETTTADIVIIPVTNALPAPVPTTELTTTCAAITTEATEAAIAATTIVTTTVTTTEMVTTTTTETITAPTSEIETEVPSPLGEGYNATYISDRDNLLSVVSDRAGISPDSEEVLRYLDSAEAYYINARVPFYVDKSALYKQKIWMHTNFYGLSGWIEMSDNIYIKSIDDETIKVNDRITSVGSNEMILLNLPQATAAESGRIAAGGTAEVHFFKDGYGYVENNGVDGWINMNNVAAAGEQPETQAAVQVQPETQAPIGVQSGSVQVLQNQDTNSSTASSSHRYELFFERISWEDAYRACRSKGGYLVRIDSDEELNRIRTMLHAQSEPNKKRYYIGARRDTGKPNGNNNYYWIDQDNRLIKDGTSALDNPGSWISAGSYWLQVDGKKEPSYEDIENGVTITENVLELMYYENNYVFNDVQNDLNNNTAVTQTIGYICEFDY